MKPNILVTGASGFLGQVLVEHLAKNFEVVSLGKSLHNQVSIDLSKNVPDLPEIDYVIHAAGKAHVFPKSQAAAQEFFDVNVTGLTHLLQGLEKNQQLPKSIVIISTVAVYGLITGQKIEETQALNGKDPYALSKIQAEKLAQEWCKNRKLKLSILRLPLIIGTNAPGNFKAMVNGIQKGRYARIGKGEACKSVIWSQDVAKVIPKVIHQTGIFNLTDGHHPRICELEQSISNVFKTKLLTIPYILAKLLAVLGDFTSIVHLDSRKFSKITSTLTFSDEKARKELQWEPTSVLEIIPEILTKQ